MTSEKSIMTLREFLKRTYGRLNILINNAGIIAKGDAPGLEVDMETVRVKLETNALGPLHLSQALVPMLQSSKPARIVNISSGMGAFSEMEGDYAAYRISKTALNAVTAILAAELRDRIAVNAACPGWVKTDMGGRNAERDEPAPPCAHASARAREKSLKNFGLVPLRRRYVQRRRALAVIMPIMPTSELVWLVRQ
jgi:NAD(P)-dependent dehydrogenase (short-subunit alcohol dehydrogenase family)